MLFVLTHTVYAWVYTQCYISSIYLSIYLPIYLSTFLPIYLSTYLPIYLPARLYMHIQDIFVYTPIEKYRNREDNDTNSSISSNSNSHDNTCDNEDNKIITIIIFNSQLLEKMPIVNCNTTTKSRNNDKQC